MSIHKHFEIKSDNNGHVDYKEKDYTVIGGIHFTAKYTIKGPPTGVWNGTLYVGDQKFPIENNAPNHEYTVKGKSAGVNTTIHVVLDWSEKKQTVLMVDVQVS